MARKALIIGCGYTGRRVAGILLAKGWEVALTARSTGHLGWLVSRGAVAMRYDATRDRTPGVSSADMHVLLSVPTLRTPTGLEDLTEGILESLDDGVRHLVYLSTTGVYGSRVEVDATTPPAPQTLRQALRRRAEEAALAFDAPSLVLRPAAIYGPGRGIQSAMQASRFRLARGMARWVSRIHVHDLARIVAASMDQCIEGAYPVADERPAGSREVAAYCARTLDLKMPPEVPSGDLPESLRTGRRVDGRAILSRLGLGLRYPSFREGIPASISPRVVPPSRPSGPGSG